MINRRNFLSLVPFAGLSGILGGGNVLAQNQTPLREPPGDGDWDWWRKLPRTPMVGSPDPVADYLCQCSRLRNDATILYNGGSQPGECRRISPLGVFTVEGYAGTYVHALCHARGAERTFRVERITSVV